MQCISLSLGKKATVTFTLWLFLMQSENSVSSPFSVMFSGNLIPVGKTLV